MERLQSAIEKASIDRQSGLDQFFGRKTNATQQRWTALSDILVNDADLRRNLIFTGSTNHQSLSYDVLRLRMMRLMRERGWKRLAITSPTKSCGKSTISLNLAFAITRQPQLRVVLIEIDTTRPSIHNLLGTPYEIVSGPGADTRASAFLRGRAAFADVAQRCGERLAIVANRQNSPVDLDCLHDNKLSGILQHLEQDYAPDLMIFDMPSFLQSEAAVAFYQQMDCVMIIAAAESSTISDIDACERELAAQSNILGVVLNKCRIMPEDGSAA